MMLPTVFSCVIVKFIDCRGIFISDVCYVLVSISVDCIMCTTEVGVTNSVWHFDCQDFLPHNNIMYMGEEKSLTHQCLVNFYHSLPPYCVVLNGGLQRRHSFSGAYNKIMSQQYFNIVMPIIIIDQTNLLLLTCWYMSLLLTCWYMSLLLIEHILLKLYTE